MNRLYLIGGPTASPSPPSHWSYSTLREWRQCPRQWSLKRAEYGGLSGRYPQPMHPAAVEGRLIHDALEAFAQHATGEATAGLAFEEIRRSFPVRSFIKNRLRRILSEEVEPNPRVDKAGLLGGISIDSCVNGFRRGVPVLRLQQSLHRPETTAARGPAPAGSQSYDGPERTITLDDPPFTGRLDWSQAGVICDFKTGDPDPTHAEQLRLYALLVWVSCGLRPDGLEIHYLRTNERVRVRVPSVSELSALREELRQEIRSANGMILNGSAPAKPSEDNCRWCPVRQICDAFWTSPATVPLRWPRPNQIPEDGTPDVIYADVRLTDFEGETSGDGYHGLAIAGDKNVAVSIPAAWTPEAGLQPRSVQLLGARVEWQSNPPTITVSRHTEVFWSGS